MAANTERDLASQDSRPTDLRAWAAALDEEVTVLRVQLEAGRRALAEAEERRDLVNRLLELEGGHEPNGARAEQSAAARPPTESKRESRGSAANPVSKTTDLEAAVEAILTEAGT